MKYVVVSDKDFFYGSYEDRGEATKRCQSLMKQFPGIKFYIYEQIYEYSVPTKEQIESDSFWK